MTVRQLLENMNQKELLNWIAYFRLEDEEYKKAKAEKAEHEDNGHNGQAKIRIHDKTNEVTQLQKDQILFSQLMMLAGQKDG